MANSTNANNPYRLDGPLLPETGTQIYATRALGDSAPAYPPSSYLAYPPPAVPPSIYSAYPPPTSVYRPAPIVHRTLGIVLILIYHALTTALIGFVVVLSVAVGLIILVPIGVGAIALMIVSGIGLWRRKTWAHILMIGGYACYGYWRFTTWFEAVRYNAAAGFELSLWNVLGSGLASLIPLAIAIYLLVPANWTLFRR